MEFKKSKILFKKAQELFPGGVNSPVRAFNNVNVDPIIVNKGEGVYITDVDKNRYIDFILSWGPLILGHSHPFVVDKVKEIIDHCISFGITNPWEIHLAEIINYFMPHIEKIRFVNSGTEATMSAIRVARGYTGRDKIIKFNGCYHGHSDFLLVNAGSGVATLSIPGTPGVPDNMVKDTLILEYNDIESFKKLMSQQGHEIAAVIVEPVAGNMGVISPVSGFLEALRDETDKFGTVLIFDEVMNGFRIAPGGARELFGIEADLTTLGKVIGGGFPVGAYGGKKEIMDLVAPKGDVYQAGTLSGNPVTMAAGWATLTFLKKNIDKWHTVSELMNELSGYYMPKIDVPVKYNQIGTMFSLFFADKIPENFNDVLKQDKNLFNNFFKNQFENGVLIAPSPYEASFLSIEHTEKELRKYWENAIKVRK